MKIKKIILYFTCVVCLSVFAVGCGGGENGLAAEEQIVNSAVEAKFQNKIISAYADKNMYISATYSNFESDSDYNCFLDFYDYYNGQFKTSHAYGFYILKYDDGFLGYYPECYNREFTIYESENDEFAVLNAYIMLRDENLDTQSYIKEDVDGFIPYNIILNMTLAAVSDEVKSEDYSLEFGTDSASSANFVNVYVGENCIGTCYYNSRVNVTVDWFKNYFKNNLFRG